MNKYKWILIHVLYLITPSELPVISGSPGSTDNGAHNNELPSDAYFE